MKSQSRRSDSRSIDITNLARLVGINVPTYVELNLGTWMLDAEIVAMCASLRGELLRGTGNEDIIEFSFHHMMVEDQSEPERVDCLAHVNLQNEVFIMKKPFS